MLIVHVQKPAAQVVAVIRVLRVGWWAAPIAAVLKVIKVRVMIRRDAPGTAPMAASVSSMAAVSLTQPVVVAAAKVKYAMRKLGCASAT